MGLIKSQDITKMLTLPKTTSPHKAQSTNCSPRADSSPFGESNDSFNSLSDRAFDSYRNEKPALIVFKQIGYSDKQKKLIKEAQEAAEMKKVADEEEAIKNAYKEKVFDEHEKTSRASTCSSQRANMEYLELGYAISDNKELVQTFETAVDNFDSTCAHVISSENQRMEAEQQLIEAIAENAGKEYLDFFKKPELHTLKRLETFERRGLSSSKLSHL